MLILARGLNIAGTFNPLPGLSYNLVPSIEVRRRSTSIEVRRRSTSIVYDKDLPDVILSINVGEFAAEKFGGARDNYCICTREERRRDRTSEARWSENGHPRARVRRRRASVGYGQPVQESVYS